MSFVRPGGRSARNAAAGLLVLWKSKIRVRFPQFATRQEAVNRNSVSLQTKDSEAVEVPLSISMHTGQIIMVTKMLASSDLRFYDFDSGVAVETWQPEQS
jgi:hypothetical protein